MTASTRHVNANCVLSPAEAQHLRSIIGPEPGRDPDTWYLYREPALFGEVLSAFRQAVGQEATHVLGIDSKGLVFGAALAREVNLPFSPMRKGAAGYRLRPPTARERARRNYEARAHYFTVQQEPLAGAKVIVADDWVDTGATIDVAVRLIERSGGRCVAIASLVDSCRALTSRSVRRLYALQGHASLKAKQRRRVLLW